MAARQDSFKDFVLDQLTELDGLSCRAMFGGYGLYRGRKFFGIIHRGRLYLKVSPETVTRFIRHGMGPFRPNGTQTLTTYYEVPVDVLENAQQLAEWAGAACALARRAAGRSR